MGEAFEAQINRPVNFEENSLVSAVIGRKLIKPF